MLENIEIIDYKCFKNFKLDGLSHINIISGGNNVGKTALLEALFIEKKVFVFEDFDMSIFTSPLITIANNRDINDNNLLTYLKTINISLKSNNKTININYKSKYRLNEEEQQKTTELNEDYDHYLVAYINDTLTLLPINSLNLKEQSQSYINSSKPNNSELVKLYSNIQTKGIQHKFLEYLKILDKNIAWLEPQLINNELLLRINLNNPEQSLISSELGEGVNRYMEILSVLLANSKDSVFIDEIENGIHYSKLKDIWKAIIEIVQNENIQLFVTTHDKESIEALIEASEESKYKDISSIQLYRDDKNKITPIVLQYKDFAYGINRGADVR